MPIGGKCLANRANHCHTAVSPFMEKTQWLIEMRSTGFIERLDKNSAPCLGRAPGLRTGLWWEVREAGGL